MASHIMSSPFRHMFAKPRERSEVADAEWYLAKWKTRPCQFSICPNAWGCPYAHGEEELRRSPFTHAYAAEACPDVPNCPRGQQCGLSHNYNEQAFHPSVYKTTACPDFPWHCNQGSRCPHAHGFKEMRALPAAAVGPRPRSTRRSLSAGRQRDLTGLPAHARAASLDLRPSAARQAERRGWPGPRGIHRRRSQPGRSQQGTERTRGDEREELTQHTANGMERIFEDSEDSMTRIANEGVGDTWQQTSAELKDVLAADLINRMMTQAEEETQGETSGDNMGAATAQRAISRGHPPGALSVKEDELSGDEGRGFVRRQVLRLEPQAPSSRGVRRHVRSASAISMGRSERYWDAGGLPHGSPGRDAPPRALLKSRPAGRRVGGSLGSEVEWQHELASLLSRHPARGKKQGQRAAEREAPEDEGRARSRGRAVSQGSLPEKGQPEGAAPASRAQQLQALVAAQREDTAHVLASAYSPTRRPSPRRSPAPGMARSTSLRLPTEGPAADLHTQVVTSRMRRSHSLGLPQRQRPAGKSSPEQMQRLGGLGGPASPAQSGPAPAPTGPPEEMGSSSSGSTASQEAAADGAQSDQRREAGKVEFLLEERVTEFNAVQARRHRRSGSMLSLDLEGKPPRGKGDDQTLGFQGRFTEEETEAESEMATEEGKGDGAVEELVKQPTGELWRWMSTDHTVEFAPLPPTKAAAASAAPPDVSAAPPVPDLAEGHLDPGVLYVLLHSHVPEACALQQRVRAICEEEGVALLWTPIKQQDGDPGTREAASDSPRSTDRSGSPLHSPWSLDDRSLGARSPRLVEKGRALSPLPSRAPPLQAMSAPTLTGPRAAIAAAEGRIAAVFAGLASTSVRFAAPFVWYLEEGSGGRERVEMLRHKHGVEFTAALPSGGLTLWLATPAVHRKVLAYLRELAGAMGGPAQLAQIQEEPAAEEGEEAGERRLRENQADTMQAGTWPSHWEVSGISSGKWHLLAVPEGSPEWTDCIAKLQGSVPPSSVVRLLRFQSPRQWQRFSAECARCAPRNLRWLFAACSKAEVQAVCSGGFTASVPEGDDVVLGSLFTAEVWQALQAAPPTSDGLRILVVVQAALGGRWWERNITQLAERVERAGEPPEFDAIVDSRTQPQVYAVARRQQAYPAYVLEVGPEVQPKQPDVRHGSFTLQEKSPDRLEKPKEAAGTKKGACCVIL